MSRPRLVAITATAAAVAASTLAAGAAVAAPAPVSLSFAQPTAAVARLQLTATASAATRSVVFRGRWKGTDGVTRTRKLGVDEVASNGYGIGWDASRVPKATTVSLTVQARDARGRVLGTSTARTWKSPGSTGSGTGTGATTDTGTVTDTGETATSTGDVAGTIVGDCPATGTCVVAVRSAATTASARVGGLASGAKVAIQCRATGQTVRTPGGTSSSWVRIGEDRWVFASYVKVPATARIAACAD